MGKLTASEARIPTETFNDVVFNGERIRVERRDRTSVVIVSEEDAALLQAVEDHYWGKMADKALAEAEAKGERPVLWDKVKKELGL